jgi:dual specificity MAP kinase phosphatase
MATLVVQHQPLRRARTPPVNLNAAKMRAGPVPNKHIPYCSPGPAPAKDALRPGFLSPSLAKEHAATEKSILYPAAEYEKVLDDPPVYSIESEVLAKATYHIASNPLPDPELVFPWLHGLHPENAVQQAFFTVRRKVPRKAPTCIRGITLVKVGGDLGKSKLKYAISPAEVLAPTSVKDSTFLELDPKEGFSVRNFHIQAAKMATLSDIVLYKDDSTTQDELLCVARRFSRAQKRYREKCDTMGIDIAEYNTFVVSCSFADIAHHHPDLVCIGSDGEATGKVIDFFHLERQEMCTMSKASLIAPNVWLGPTPDPSIMGAPNDVDEAPEFDIMIEASDLARLPESKTLKKVAEGSASEPQMLEFPSSGSIMPPTWSHAEVDGLLEICRWIYDLSSGKARVEPAAKEEELDQDQDGDIQMQTLRPRGRKILIHCADGYTESTLLALTYFMYVECIPVHEAWVRMHCEKGRNFFAYPSDVSVLTTIQPRILQESPKGSTAIPSSLPEDPAWLKRLDGSLPSRILPYMYLGNLGHANNPELLKIMGIHRVLSVGEPISWDQTTLEDWGTENLMYIDRVQDNGVDPLTNEFDRCLSFIGMLSFDKPLQRC